MKLMIEIEDKLYTRICMGKDISEEENSKLGNIIADGTPQPKWIPVSESNLPEDDSRVLVTVQYKQGEPEVAMADYYRGFRVDNIGCLDINDKGLKSWRLIAWMPLPQPYKEDKGD